MKWKPKLWIHCSNIYHVSLGSTEQGKGEEGKVFYYQMKILYFLAQDLAHIYITDVFESKKGLLKIRKTFISSQIKQ